jgi:hypothetical protein
VGLRAGLDTEARGKIFCLYRVSNPGRPDIDGRIILKQSLQKYSCVDCIESNQDFVNMAIKIRVTYEQEISLPTERPTTSVKTADHDVRYIYCLLRCVTKSMSLCIGRVGRRRVGAPGRIIIYRPFKLTFFKYLFKIY